MAFRPQRRGRRSPRRSVAAPAPLRFASWLLASLLLLGAGYRLEPGADSHVGYHASTPLERWSGRAPIERLTLTFDDERIVTGRIEIEIDPARFDSGNVLRDVNARRTVFEPESYARSVFTGRVTEADGAGLPAGATRRLTVRGTLLLHGVEREVDVPVTVTRSGDEIVARASFGVRLSDFAMHRPTLLFVVVDDEVTIEIELRGRLVATAP